jgi:predicted nucleic acid-binding protein
VILVDSGPIVAYLGRNEQQHAWTRQAFRRVPPPFFVCEAVLSEVTLLLHHRPHGVSELRSWLRQGLLIHAPLSALMVRRALSLMERYRSVSMSFAEGSIVTLNEQHPEAMILTLDSNFLTYRRNEDQPLKLLAPFRG